MDSDPTQWSTERFLEFLKSRGMAATPGRLTMLTRTHCERDIHLFARLFFDHHVRLPFGPMHLELLRLYWRSLASGSLGDRAARRLAIAAPRGAAKSTLKSLIFPIHAVLYGCERYVLIVSATLRQARLRLRNIQSELRANARLGRFFESELSRRGRWSQQSLEVNDAQIEAYSAGTELRGISYGPWRPTLVVLDDVENSDAVRSTERRVRLLEWYNEVIENLGDSYTAIEIVGTLLHPDSLLANLLKRPDYETRVYRSIERFADRADLWEQWRSLYGDLSDVRRLETARDFFERRRDEMLGGSRVLWPAKEDYYSLMCQMATRGRRAFFKEKQNEPGVGESAFFDLARAARFSLDGDRIVLERRAESAT